MTTGVTEFGSETSSSYYRKTWSGTDGKMNNGTIVWNPYNMSLKKAFSTPGSGYPPLYDPLYMGVVWGPQNVAWGPNDTLDLINELGSKVRGHSFNLGVALGESHQTLNLVLTNLRRITSAISSLKKGRVDLALRALGVPPKPTKKRAKQRTRRTKGRKEFVGYVDGQPVYSYQGETIALKRTSNSNTLASRELVSKDISAMWLEIQYGVKPLLSDIFEAMKAYERHTAGPRKSRFTVRKRIEWPIYESNPAVNTYAKWTIHSQTKRQIIAELTEVISEPRSLGLLDPASVAWELTPLSFVADWFIPIGSYLEALNVIPMLTGRFLVSDLTTSTTSGTGLKTPYLGATCSAETVTITRTPSTSISVPFPQFKPLNQALSVGHIKNAIALLHQVSS